MKNKDINLYDIFTSYSYDDILELIQSSKSKEEQDFYALLSDLVLQREQEKIIGK